jgi:hypothetical protein
MNERQFQREFVAEAPVSVPDSLRERVEAITATDANGPAAPGSQLRPAGQRRGATLGLRDLWRQPRTLATLVLAALAAAGAVALGSLLRAIVTG